MSVIKWKDLPVEIQEKMLNEQVKQGNDRDANVFINNLFYTKDLGGFNWSESIDKSVFWIEILSRGNFSEFYKCYPKISEDKIIDWEQRRYELAKAAMQGLMVNYLNAGPSLSETVEFSIKIADLMISKLKKYNR